MSETQHEGVATITPQLQIKIDRFLHKVREKLKEPESQFTPLDDGSGYCGTYYSGFTTRSNNPDVVFHVSFIDSAGKSTKLDYSFTNGGKEHADIAQQALDDMLEREFKLFRYSARKDYLTTLDDQQLGFFIRRELKKTEQEYPDEFSFSRAGGRQYTCNVDIELPSAITVFKPFLKVKIRPHEDTDSIKDKYLKRPASVPLHRAAEAYEQIESLRKKVEAILGVYKITPYTIKETGLKDEQKEIPKEWIDVEKVRLATRTFRDGTPFYRVEIVPEDTSGRIPAITLKFSGITEQQAEAITGYVKNEAIPPYLARGERSDQPLNLKSIRQLIEKKFPDYFQKNMDAMPRRLDKRDIVARTQDGAKIVAKLCTPILLPKQQAVTINLSVPEQNPGLGTKYSVVQHSLNTSDRDLFLSRTDALQSLSKAVLDEYFQRNPNTEIMTESQVLMDKGKQVTAIVFARPKPNEIAPDGKVFFATLRDEVLKPAFEQFNRYIYWQTSVTQDDEGYKITAQLKRNEQAETFPEGDNFLGRTWEFRASTKDQATEFTHRLEENILRTQHLFSRSRPADKFGVHSMRVAATGSLLDTMVASPTVQDLQPKLTSGFQSRTIPE